MVQTPMVLARAPNGRYDVAARQAPLRAVGLATVTTEMVAREGYASDALSVAIGYCQGTSMRTEIEAHDPDRLAAATDVATAAITRQFAPGKARAKVRGHIITAVWNP